MDRTLIEELQEVPDPYGEIACIVLQQRAIDGARRRFQMIGDEAKKRLLAEFQAVLSTDTAKLFLFWSDAVARIGKKTYSFIPGTANCSLLAYCLGITQVDPLQTDSPFDRWLNGYSRHVPVLLAEVPCGKREEVLRFFSKRELAFLTIEENRSLPDLPPQQAASFFNGQCYEDGEILRQAAAAAGPAGRDKWPKTIGELADLLAIGRYAELTAEAPGFLYQEDGVGLLVKAGFSRAQAEGARRAFARHDEAEIGFYKSTFLQAAWMAGTKKDEAEDAFFAFGRHINFTVCRASYMAMAQYLYMAAFFSEKGGKKEKGLCM